MRTSTRELVILIRTEVDKAVANDFRNIAQLARDAQTAQVKGSKAAGDAMARAARDAAKAWQEEERDASAACRAATRTAELEARKTAKAQADATREAAKAQQQAARDTAKAQEQQARQHAAIAKAAENAGLKAATAGGKMATSVAKTAHGVEQLARGFVLLGVASEDDFQKAVQSLAAFEGAVDIMKGLGTVLKGVTGGWKAYAAAVALAAAAEKARAAANTANTLTSAGGSIAQTVGGVSAAGGGLAVRGIGMAAGALNTLNVAAAGVGISLATVTQGILAIGTAAWALHETTQDAKRRIVSRPGENTEGPGWWSRQTARLGQPGYLARLGGVENAQSAMEEADRSTRKVTSGEIARDERLVFQGRQTDQLRQQTSDYLTNQARMDALHRETRYGEGLGGLQQRSLATAGAAAEANLDAEKARKNYGTFENQYNRTGEISNATAAATAEEAYIREVERAKKALEDSGEAALALNKARQQSATEVIASLRQEIDMHRQLSAAGRSKEEQFAELNPFEQQRLKALRKRFDEGGQMSAKELAELKPWVGGQAQQKASDRLVAQAEKSGFANVYGKGEWEHDSIKNQEAVVKGLETKVKLQSDYKVSLAFDEKKLVAGVTDAINATLKQIEQHLKSELARKLPNFVRMEQEAQDLAHRNLTQRQAQK